jgi:dienelactone hydrolase
MKKSSLSQLLAAIFLSAPVLFAADPAPTPAPPDFDAMRAEVEALGDLNEPPKYEVLDRPDATPNLKPIFYSGFDYQGKPTTVFAWLGVPENTEGKKVPAVVLAHGGGGAASKDWVKNWNKQGYAAISMSLEGQTEYDPALKGNAKNPNGGPGRPGIFGDSAEPITDQWMYQTIANVNLAAALLRSLPEVDPSKVGIMGCSWGGIITATAIGIDPRYAFAIPVYGCGGLDAIPNHYGGTLEKNEVYKKVWDANLRLDRARMPILWQSWPQDAHFSMEAVNNSRKKAGSKISELCLIPGMGHGNLAERPEWFEFANSVLKDGKPWIQAKSSKLEENEIEAAFESSKPLESAVLVSTTDTGHTGTRTWVETPATLTQEDGLWVAEAEVPAGTTACFLNVKTGPLTATSDYFEIK